METESFGDIEKEIIPAETIYEQSSGKMNEDDYISDAENGIYLVIDGATSLVPFEKQRKTGGRLAADIVKGVYKENIDKPLEETALLANQALLKAMYEAGIDTDDKKALWSTTVAGIRIKGDSIEYFSIGDSIVLFIFKDGSYKVVTEDQDHDRFVLAEWKELVDQGKDINQIWKEAKNLSEKLREKSNEDYGFLNGESKAKEFFKTSIVKKDDVRSVIIFTDGLLFPKEDPMAEENWAEFVKIYDEKGLRGLYDYKYAIEESDPGCQKYIRAKNHDDTTAISLEI